MTRIILAAIFLASVAFPSEAKLRFKQYLKQESDKRQVASCAPDEFSCAEKCIPNSYVCDTENDCSDGLDEHQNCPTDCSGVNQFKCPDAKCISSYYRCDASNDCSDGSDEKECGGSCRGNDFKCGNGACISHGWICDGDNDCGDQTDEANCGSSCRNGYFHCASGACITNTWVCDGDNDCHDNSDELNCTARTCTPSQFTCTNNKCIPAGYKCDHDNDCGDNSDEQGCTCASDHFQCPKATPSASTTPTPTDTAGSSVTCATRNAISRDLIYEHLNSVTRLYNISSLVQVLSYVQ
ncbi:hypothetical protein Btru_044695 [Bulinus truncatus]|nr:hypothetical protein Btru_044695 [Bulinus truncatus]